MNAIVSAIIMSFSMLDKQIIDNYFKTNCCCNKR